MGKLADAFLGEKTLSLPGGLFAQPIEMGVHSWNPSSEPSARKQPATNTRRSSFQNQIIQNRSTICEPRVKPLGHSVERPFSTLPESNQKTSLALFSFYF